MYQPLCLRKTEVNHSELVVNYGVFTPSTGQDKTILSRLELCSHRQRALIETGSRRDKTVLSRRAAAV